MVALKNGIIQNKDRHPFDRSTGTWKKQNENSSTETQQADTENKQSDVENQNEKSSTQNEKPDAAENPDEVKEDNENKQTDAKEEQPGNKNEQPDTKTKETPAKTPKPDDEILKPPAGTLKPLTIDLYIDGKQIHFPFDDLSHFNELRAQLASGIPLDDDLIRKIKPILAEAHLRDGTKIFNNEAQLDDIMKHYRGKQISSFDDLLEFVLRKIR